MRTFVTLIAALVLGWLAGSMAALGMAERAQGDETYVLAFIAAACAAVIWVIPFLIASTRAVPRTAMRRVALWSLGAVGLALGGLSAFELFVNGTFASALRGIQLLAAIAASTAVVIVVQWLVFRFLARAPAQIAMSFGRGPGARA